MEIKKYCNGDYSIICICEGAAEEDVINWLLDEEKLLFKRDNLVGKNRYKVTRIRKAKKIESDILSLDFDKPVVIFRIVDSKNEKFELGNLYRDRYEACIPGICNDEKRYKPSKIKGLGLKTLDIYLVIYYNA